MSHPCSPICSRILVQWVNKTTNYTSLMVLRIWNKITVRDAYWHDMCFLHFCACKFYIECRKDLDNLIMSLIITSNWYKKPWAKHPILHRFICFQPFACIVNANLRHFNKLLIRFLIGERSLAWQIRLMRILHSKKKNVIAIAFALHLNETGKWTYWDVCNIRVTDRITLIDIAYLSFVWYSTFP